MYILLEHDGTEERAKLAQDISYYLENNLGATCDEVVGDDSQAVGIYDGSFSKLASFNKLPTEAELNFFVALIDEE